MNKLKNDSTAPLRHIINSESITYLSRSPPTMPHVSIPIISPSNRKFPLAIVNCHQSPNSHENAPKFTFSPSVIRQSNRSQRRENVLCIYGYLSRDCGANITQTVPSIRFIISTHRNHPELVYIVSSWWI